MKKSVVLLDVFFEEFTLFTDHFLYPPSHFRRKPLPAYTYVQVGLVYNHLKVKKVILPELFPVRSFPVFQLRT